MDNALLSDVEAANHIHRVLACGRRGNTRPLDVFVFEHVSVEEVQCCGGEEAPGLPSDRLVKRVLAHVS